jgi:hypothetical protein
MRPDPANEARRTRKPSPGRTRLRWSIGPDSSNVREQAVTGIEGVPVGARDQGGTEGAGACQAR